MPASNSTMIRRLQTALNQKFGVKLLINKNQFYSEEQNRPITSYVLKRMMWDENEHKEKATEIFKSFSQIQVVLYLRDWWYFLNEWEILTDNEMWNAIKEKNAIHFTR